MTKALTVDELRTALIETHGIDEEEVAGMKKADLKDRLEQCEQSDFDLSFSEDEDNVVTANKQARVVSLASKLPPYGSPEWTEHVLSLMEKDEIHDGHPKHAGLRRVAQLLLGDIVHSGASFVSVIPTHEGRAVTVGYEVTFNWHLDLNLSSLDTSFLYKKTFGGLADCELTDTVYGKHPAATAETKAASRALKKALGINVLTFEEKISGQDDEISTEKISKSMINTGLVNMIRAKVKTINSDLNKTVDSLIKEMDIGNKALEELSMQEGRDLFKHINKYQQDS